MSYLIAIIIWGIIWGSITKYINENKGYEGGFWWGFWLGFIGLIVIACKQNNTNNTKPDYATSTYMAALASEKNDERIISNGGWKCTRCGRVNPNYTGTCGCGMSKANVDKSKSKQNELDNLKKLKEYKELLDMNVITQEDFDKKKAELLNL